MRCDKDLRQSEPHPAAGGGAGGRRAMRPALTAARRRGSPAGTRRVGAACRYGTSAGASTTRKPMSPLVPKDAAT